MLVSDLLTQVQTNLQDSNADYWSETELLDLFNECKRFMTAERKEKVSTVTVNLIDGTYEYSPSGVLRYISAIDSDGSKRDLYPDDGSDEDELSAVIIKDFDSIYVNNPVTGVDLTLKVVSMPSDSLTTDTIRSGDENAYKYYILSKAYEKESDLENFQKAQYFGNMFVQMFKPLKKTSSQNNRQEMRTTEAHWF